MFIRIFILSLLILFASTSFASGDVLSSKKGNFSKGNFSENSVWNKNSKNDYKRQLGPPGPGGGTGGHPAPISGGIYILLAGSALFIAKKIKNEIESHQNEHKT